MGTIEVDEVVRGDVLLVTRRPRNAYADVIVGLDGAPAAFTHSGVALGAGRILSSYPVVGGLSLPVVLGGLRADDFGRFWGYAQAIHRLDVDPVERSAAAVQLEHYEQGPRGFSVPKLVVVAATLHALSPSNPIPPEATARVVRRAIALAEAWADDGGSYCAEFVARLYGWRFTLADLVPPAWSGPVTVPHLARASADLVATVLSAHRTELQKRTVRAFLAEVRRSDPTFFGPRPLASLDRRDLTARVDPDLDPVDESPLDLATVLPCGLVTPRMLRARHVGEEDPPAISQRSALELRSNGGLPKRRRGAARRRHPVLDLLGHLPGRTSPPPDARPG